MRKILKNMKNARAVKSGRFARLAALFALLPIFALCAFRIAQPARAADEYSYIFEYTTNNISQGDSDLESRIQIEFFIITYNTSASGKELHSQFLFPYEDSLKNGYKLVDSSEQERLDREISNRYGEQAPSLTNQEPFKAFKTTQYFFTSPHIIRDVERVQILASGDSGWECQGMRLFRVDKLGGLRRYNPISQDIYIDFEGQLLAETEARSLSWSTDKLIPFSKAGNGDYNISTSFSQEYAKHEIQATASQKTPPPTFAVRMDFADFYGAGLECLAAPPNALGKPNDNKRYKLTDNSLYFPEVMSVTIRYRNRYGNTCSTEAPFVIGAAEWARSRLGNGDVELSGIAQQGESLMTAIFIPDFGEFELENGNNNLVFTLGAQSANAKLGASCGSYNSYLAGSASDSAMFTAVALYDLRGENQNKISVSMDSLSKTPRYQYDIDPIACRVATSLEGELLGASQDTSVALSGSRPNSELAARDKTTRYLAEIKTDDLAQAATKSKVTLQINYRDYNNVIRNIDVDIYAAASHFYGYWPGSPNAYVGYYQGTSRGGTLRFTFSVANIKEISDVTLTLTGDDKDDWQITDFSLFKVKSMGQRVVTWKDLKTPDGVSSDRIIDRNVQATLIYSRMNQTENPTNPPDPDNPTPTPPANPTPTGAPILILPDSDPISVGPDSGDADVTKPTRDWSKLRYSMSYQEASQDLQFTEERCRYNVEVKVSDTDDRGGANGDCGSKNLFYFRLIFNNGSSGFVLANQQLEADGFRTGQTERFTISTNQDYGDVVTVQIFPEDVAEDSDKYDKLKIDEINVSRSADAALVPTWTVHNVGWIDISFRDEGQLQSVSGQAGRSTTEIIRPFNVDQTSYRARLLFSIKTGEYDLNTNGQRKQQFEGTLKATLHYADTSGTTKEFTDNNVIGKMYEYIHQQPKKRDDGIIISDPNLMFRENHTDRFVLEVADVASLYRLELLPGGNSNVSTKWNIDSVTVSLIRSEGTLKINRDEEYDQGYKANLEPVYITSHDSETQPAYWQEITSTGVQTIKINFLDNKVELSPDAKMWRSVVTQLPPSQNDTLNLFIYPDTSNLRVGESYTPRVRIRYTDVEANECEAELHFDKGDLHQMILEDNQLVYYAVGVNVSKMSSLGRISVRTVDTDNNVNANDRMLRISRALVQRVRDGVVIEAKEMTGSGFGDYGVDLADRATSSREEQHVLIQLGTDMKKSVLNPGTDTKRTGAEDIAVALWYRTDNPSNSELRSPYVFLTDANYTSISPGQVLDLTFNQVSIQEITGVSIVGQGSVSASVDAVYVADEILDKNTGEFIQTKSEYGSADSLAVTNTPRRINLSRSAVQPLELRFETGDASGNINGGTSGPVRVTLGYYNQENLDRQKEFPDIRPYLTDGNNLQSGTTRTARMLIPDISEVRWVELEPASEAASEVSATWNLKSVTSALGERVNGTKWPIDRVITEGAPIRVMLTNVLLSATADTFTAFATPTPVPTEAADNASTAETTPTPITAAELTPTATPTPLILNSGSSDIFIESGDGIWIIPSLVGSFENLTVTLEKRELATGATGKVNLADTRGYTTQKIAQDIAAKKSAFRDTFITKFSAYYTQEQLDEMITKATDSAEKEIWLQGGPYDGSFTPGATNNLENETQIRFIPPRNFTSATLGYQIRIYSNEANAAEIILNVAVQNEVDQYSAALAAYDAACTNLDNRITAEVEKKRQEQEAAEQRQRAEEERARYNNPLISIYQDTGSGYELLFRANRDNIASVSYADDELQFIVQETAGERTYTASGHDTQVYGAFDVGNGEQDMFDPVYLDEFEEYMLDEYQAYIPTPTPTLEPTDAPAPTIEPTDAPAPTTETTDAPA